MLEGKTKARRGQIKAKRPSVTAPTTKIKKTKPTKGSVKVSVKNKVVSKPQKKLALTAPRKVRPVKKAITARPPATTVAFQPIRPLTPLPKPLEVAPQLNYNNRIRRARWQLPHRWSLRHNIFTIFVLTLVGFSAIWLVALYANLTFSYINIYGATETHLLKPIRLTERNFQLTAGTFTVTFPASYAVAASGEDSLEWQYTAQPDNTVTLRLYKNESDNVFTWLQQNQPEYISAKVVTPTPAVAAVNGILVEAENADGVKVNVAYWSFQKNLAEKYIIEVMTVGENDDLETFVSGTQLPQY